MAKIFEEDENDILHRLAKTGKSPKLGYERKWISDFVEGFKYNLTSFLRLSKYVIDYLFMVSPEVFMFSSEMASMIKLAYCMNKKRDFKYARAIATTRRHFEVANEDSSDTLIYTVDLIEFSAMTGYITVLYANVDKSFGFESILEERVIFGIKDCRIDDIKSNVFDPYDKEINLIMNKYFDLMGRKLNIITLEKDDEKCLTTSEKLLLR